MTRQNWRLLSCLAVLGAGGAFVVTGGHTYAWAGAFAVSVSVTPAAGPGLNPPAPSVTAGTTVTVLAPPALPCFADAPAKRTRIYALPNSNEAEQDVSKELEIDFLDKNRGDKKVGSIKYAPAKVITVESEAKGAKPTRLHFAQRVDAEISKALWDSGWLDDLGHPAKRKFVPPGHELGFDRMHLLADEFGGRGDARNVFSLQEDQNRGKGEYRAAERAIGKALEELKEPDDKVTLSFVAAYARQTAATFGKTVGAKDKDREGLLAPGRLRPTSVRITLTVNQKGKASSQQTYDVDNGAPE